MMHLSRRWAMTALAVVGACWMFAPSTPAFADSCDGPGVRALVNDQSSGKKVPIPGVSVEVDGSDGAAIGQAVTDAKGVALICLAEKADLTVKVDTATLPEGKSLEAGTESLTILDRKSTRLNSSHIPLSRMPSSA